LIAGARTAPTTPPKTSGKTFIWRIERFVSACAEGARGSFAALGHAMALTKAALPVIDSVTTSAREGVSLDLVFADSTGGHASQC
jgi:hypothetical protein